MPEHCRARADRVRLGLGRRLRLPSRTRPPDRPHAARSADPETLITAARAGDSRALGRLVSLVENEAPELRRVMKVIAPLTGNARVVGLTGSPGVGKSTVTSALVRSLPRGRASASACSRSIRPRRSAAAPCSATGSACRTTLRTSRCSSGRWPAAGHLGGLAWATPQALRILDAAGFDIVLVETVGVGQAEVEIASLADTALVVVAPGLGDSIQAAKAGILEIADLFVVNKSDRPGAQEVVRDLRTMLAMARYGDEQWKPPIISVTAATRRGHRGPGRRDRQAR